MHTIRSKSGPVLGVLFEASKRQSYSTYKGAPGSMSASTIEPDNKKSDPIYKPKPYKKQTASDKISQSIIDSNDHQGIRSRRGGGHSIGITNPVTFDSLRNQFTDKNNYVITGEKKTTGPSGSDMKQIRFESKDKTVSVNIMNDNKSSSKPFSLTGPEAMHVKVAKNHEIIVAGTQSKDLVIHQVLAGPEASPEMKYREHQRRKEIKDSNKGE